MDFVLLLWTAFGILIVFMWINFLYYSCILWLRHLMLWLKYYEIWVPVADLSAYTVVICKLTKWNCMHVRMYMLFCSFGVRRGKTRHTSRRAQQGKPAWTSVLRVRSVCRNYERNELKQWRFSAVSYIKKILMIFVITLCVDMIRILWGEKTLCTRFTVNREKINLMEGRCTVGHWIQPRG